MGRGGSKTKKGVCKVADSHLVNLSDHSIHHLSFKRPEHNGLVFDWIEDKTPAWLDYTCPDVVNSGDCDDKAIPGNVLKEEEEEKKKHYVNICQQITL